jgi:hypothetical protein
LLKTHGAIDHSYRTGFEPKQHPTNIDFQLGKDRRHPEETEVKSRLEDLSDFPSCASFPYERSQLPCNSGLFLRGLSRSGRCRNGCDRLESPCHLFSHCPIFSADRESTLADISRLSQEILEDVPLVIRCCLCESIPSLLSRFIMATWSE